MTSDRAKLLVHVRRISDLFETAIRIGPDGTLEGKFRDEQPVFTHHALVFYLAGCMAYLENESGTKSWQIHGSSFTDFDVFIDSFEADHSFKTFSITKASLDALLCIRNACVHNSNDLSRNHDQGSLNKVMSAALPSVVVLGTIVSFKANFLEFVRLATLAVRMYHGDN
jgi:hypothetical protein